MAPKEERPAKGEAAGPRVGDSEKSVPLDVQNVKDLYELMVAEGLDFLDIKDDTSHIKLNRVGPPIECVPGASVTSRRQGSSLGSSSSSASSRAAADNHKSIEAPLAGVFYRASSPTTPPFSKEGDLVETGQTLCIIEAMKVMNEIKADARCKIVRIVAENSRPVTAGQALFLVEPA